MDKSSPKGRNLYLHSNKIWWTLSSDLFFIYSSPDYKCNSSRRNCNVWFSDY